MRTLLLVIALLSVGQDKPKVFHLHVVNGSPTGDFMEGEAVHIHANAAKEGWSFSHWLVRRDCKINNLNRMDAILIMPARNANIGWTSWKAGN